MARLPIYLPQSNVSASRLEAGAAGGASAQAMAQAGGALVDIGATMKRREDVIDRTVRLGELNNYAQESLSALRTEDLAKEETINNYMQGLRARADELMAGHAGTSASRAEFKAQVENQIAQYAQGANNARTKAVHQRIGTIIEQKTNQLASQASFAPHMIADIFQEFDRELDGPPDSEVGGLGAALPAEVVQQYKNSARSAIAQTAISHLMSEGNIDAAEELLRDPNVNKYLNPDASRRFNINIGAERGKQAEAQRRIESNVTAWRQVLPNMTPEQENMVRQLPIKRSDMSIAEKIVELEMIQGTAATGDQIQRIMGMGADSGIFGNSLDGRSLKFVTENADRYRMGLLNPQEALQFQAMYNQLYGPKERIDPFTQLLTTTTPSVPPALRQAMTEGASFYGNAPMGRGAPGAPSGLRSSMGGEDIDMSFTRPDGTIDYTARPPQPGEANYQAPDQMQGVDSQIMSPDTPTINQAMQSGRTVWQRRETVTGPVATGAQALGALPGVGQMFGGGGTFTVDRQFVDAISKELIRSLSQSGRYLATEMQSIEKEVSIGGRLIDNDEAYALRLIGIDQALEARVQGEMRILSNPRTPMDQRRNAQSVVNTINNFRAVLDVPPSVTTREELFSYPPGTVVYTPQGFKQVPEQQQ